MADLFPPSIDDQIAEAERELAMRRHAYPRWVASGTLKADRAERQVKAMEAILDTLRAVKARGQ